MDRSGGGNLALYFFSAALNADQPWSTSTGLFFVDFQCNLRAFLYSLLSGEIIDLSTNTTKQALGRMNTSLSARTLKVIFMVLVCRSVTGHVVVASPLASSSRRIPCS